MHILYPGIARRNIVLCDPGYMQVPQCRTSDRVLYARLSVHLGQSATALKYCCLRLCVA